MPEMILCVWGMLVLVRGVSVNYKDQTLSPSGAPSFAGGAELGWLALGGILVSAMANGWLYGVEEIGRDSMIAIGMNGEALPIEHGFPVRTLVPGLYGYVSATKWVVDLEVTRFADFSAYWTQRGWGERGPVKIASRIDVPRSGEDVPAGRVERPRTQVDAATVAAAGERLVRALATTTPCATYCRKYGAAKLGCNRAQEREQEARAVHKSP